MDATAGAAAAKFQALNAELAAKSSRVAELEARVSFLEAENARLREALAACPRAAAGDEDPESGHRLAAGFLRKHESAEQPGGSVAGDVIEVSDDVIEVSDEEEEEGVRVTVTIDASSKGRSPEEKEEGVVADLTPRKREVTGESEDAEGGGGSSSSRGNNVGLGLEDDDVFLASPWGRKKRAAARLVTSDSEDEDAKHGVDDPEEGCKPSKKRGFRGICDSDDEDANATEGVHVVTLKAAQIESGEDEDDTIPICQVLKKMRKERANHDDDKLGEVKRCSTPQTRRSARLVKNQSKGGQRAARRVLNFVEPNECEGSQDDIEAEEDDMEDFINDDEDSSEDAVESAEESCCEPQVSGTSFLNEESSAGPDESDSVVDYADVMASVGRKNKPKDWKFEGDMLAAFNKHPELCLKAVCALYRRQTEEEQMHKATFVHNKQGFSQIHAPRASCIVEFLLDGDLYGPVKKTISDLKEYDRYALDFCRKMASNYSKQVFEIYQNKEDPYFHP